MRTLPDDPLFPERRIARVQTVLVEKGRSRRIEAGQDGIRYLSVHLRRPGLQLGRFG